jgi:lipoate-protein ligase A
MAIDEAIFSSYKENISKPTLRIYGWTPACFSVGYSQNPKSLIDIEACKNAGISIVRRPTGGGLIFHDKELTYSVILCQQDIGLTYRIKESFEIITSFLFDCYSSLGAQACFAKDKHRACSPGRSIAPLCFSRNEEYDILVNGKKLGGNAQKRNRSIILQHGSIPLSLDEQKISIFLKNPEILSGLEVSCINEISKEKISFERLSTIVANAFSFHFKTLLKTEGLTQEEAELSEKLKLTKYSTLKWNLNAASSQTCVA